MTPSLLVLVFAAFIVGTVGPVIGILLYSFFVKKINKPFVLNLTKVFTGNKPKMFLSSSCCFLGILSIGVSLFLTLFIGFENNLTRDLGLFVGLWAVTLFSLASFFKN